MDRHVVVVVGGSSGVCLRLRAAVSCYVALLCGCVCVAVLSRVLGALCGNVCIFVEWLSVCLRCVYVCYAGVLLWCCLGMRAPMVDQLCVLLVC